MLGTSCLEGDDDGGRVVEGGGGVAAECSIRMIPHHSNHKPQTVLTHNSVLHVQTCHMVRNAGHINYIKNGFVCQSYWHQLFYRSTCTYTLGHKRL